MDERSHGANNKHHVGILLRRSSPANQHLRRGRRGHLNQVMAIFLLHHSQFPSPSRPSLLALGKGLTFSSPLIHAFRFPNAFKMPPFFGLGQARTSLGVAHGIWHMGLGQPAALGVQRGDGQCSSRDLQFGNQEWDQSL